MILKQYMASEAKTYGELKHLSSVIGLFSNRITDLQELTALFSLMSIIRTVFGVHLLTVIISAA